ncbi:Asp-tRNA(Asn)/Glu-tRNA(Gln) amidotransferase subunit GatC [Candidatus Saccharibacteria bacterium]|nr:Asp-tRNA(Asn)/Glu-tRNA(Gln) amidotransferase subunit GatC [Candidatus Saccharibacteria bacterium]MCB9821618.1 Asp-tRNA(Asn)/Glu-tRNA(Gln) amidotransferase subunit GatC [Candidatus Nomurabacteria bacterium]
MSKITASDVAHLAKLARLSLTDIEIKKFQSEIEAIFEFVDQLQSVDVSDYEPTDQVSGLKNITRNDQPQDFGVDAAGLLKGGRIEDNQFIVERVIE